MLICFTCYYVGKKHKVLKSDILFPSSEYFSIRYCNRCFVVDKSTATFYFLRCNRKITILLASLTHLKKKSSYHRLHLNPISISRPFYTHSFSKRLVMRLIRGRVWQLKSLVTEIIKVLAVGLGIHLIVSKFVEVTWPKELIILAT